MKKVYYEKQLGKRDSIVVTDTYVRYRKAYRKENKKGYKVDETIPLRSISRVSTHASGYLHHSKWYPILLMIIFIASLIMTSVYGMDWKTVLLCFLLIVMLFSTFLTISYSDKGFYVENSKSNIFIDETLCRMSGIEPDEIIESVLTAMEENKS